MTGQERTIEAHGDDVEAAIASGLRTLGLQRDQVTIEVLDEGSRGFLGIGSRQASVRLKAQPVAVPPVVLPQEVVPQERLPQERVPQPEPVVARPVAVPVVAAEVEEAVDEEEPAVPPTLPPATMTPPRSARPVMSDEDEDELEGEPADAALEGETAREIVQMILDKMQVRATTSVHLSDMDEETGRQIPIVEVRGRDLGGLIGPHGETLNALQYLSRLMLGHQMRTRPTFIIDVEGYRQRREQALARLAERMASKVIQTGRPQNLEPMPPNERRIIHMTLREHKHVYTHSVGEGNRRRVRILPKR
jgi:spoIIIJ-associated protein